LLAGIRDVKTVSQNSTLAELGMDSMTAVEIKDTLEREFDVYLTPQEIRTLTFARLGELSAANQCTEAEKQQLQGARSFVLI
jgi:fatty acid synthase